MSGFDWDAFEGRPTTGVQRHPHTGAPYVNHSTRVTKAGRPARVMFGRPSSAYAQIDNTYNLQKWSERMTLIGAVRLMLNGELLPDDLDLVDRYDNDEKDDKRYADELVVRAKEAAQADLAARRGTFVHEVTEVADEDSDAIARMENGETLGIEPEVVDAVVRCWRRMLTEYGLEILDVELFVVDDLLNLAGTLDRVARLGRDLTLPFDGGEVTIPAGTVIVLDVKTGQIRTNTRGDIDYWHGYALQVASYAQSRRYIIDNDGERRGRWHRRPSQEHALIAHIDVGAALESGLVAGRLIYVNLAAGREAGRLVLKAKQYARRRDVLGQATAAPIIERVS